MAKIDLTSNEWVDMVFEGRNQAYGAYKLRKNTSRRNILAIIIMLIAAAIIATILGINTIIENQRKRAAITQVTEVSALNQPKKEAKVQQKKIQVEPEKVVERVKSSIKFVAPVIKKDNEVKPEEELKTQDEILNSKTDIGSFTVQGNDDKNGEILKAKETIAQPEPPKHEEENAVFDIVEQMPLFPGGNAALMKYLNDNIRYPVVAQENGVQGRVVVSFVVEKNGSITDVKVVRSVDPSLDKEAARVVSGMPNWTPGKQNGSNVRVKYNVPVTFRLQQ